MKFRTRASKMKKVHRGYAIVKRIPCEQPCVGVEIGVLNGATSAKILENCTSTIHYMVDPWSAKNKDDSYIKSGSLDSQASQEWFEENFRIALADTEPYEDRRRIRRMKSAEVVHEFSNDTLNYVFIDGDHSYEGVCRDINLWYPKVKKGGWIGGHDWESKRHPAVSRAVRDTLGEPHETDVDKTWFVWK